MFFTIGLYISLAIFAIGIIYKVSRWFRLGLTDQDRSIGVGSKISAVLRAIGSAFSGKNLLLLIKAFFLDILLLRRSFIQDKFRWAMHMLIFWGFILLFFMHALEKFISEPYLPNYMSTLNPYLFLRDFFGLMVIAGIAMALYRRFLMPKPRLRTKAMDVITIIILSVIIISGFLLKGSKIASTSDFMRMVQEYSHIYYYEEEVESLESYWVQEFGLISPNVQRPFSEENLAEGEETHDMFCAYCHSDSQWAPLSYGASKLTYPITRSSDGSKLVSFFWYLHVLACFAGLAWIPFGKMFHMFTSPLSLFAAATNTKKPDPAATAVRRVMEMDACTRCGACSERCSVGIASEPLSNNFILPAEKLLALKKVAAGKHISKKERRSLTEGLVVCTSCFRCADVCPVGINLQDIWTSVREDLLRSAIAEPYVLSPLSLYSILKEEKTGPERIETPRQTAKKVLIDNYPQASREQTLIAKPKQADLKSRLQTNTDINFNYCFNCRTCTSACPVLNYFEQPEKELGLLPHQIIHATILGLNDLVAPSRMLWACLGCYQCQEQCPQGVRVTDVLYAHKQAVLAGLKAGDGK